MEKGISGCRLKLCSFHASKSADITLRILVIMYFILMFGLFLVEDFIMQGLITSVDEMAKEKYKGVTTMIVSIELFTSILFVIDILIQLIGYGSLYL